MADGARVHDVEALNDLQAYLGRFREDLTTRCDEIRLQFQRVSAWLEGEATSYWRTQKQRAEQRVAEAREALAMCRAKARDDDDESCSEQLRQFERAKARLAFCENQAKHLKVCQLEWEQFSLQALPRVAETSDLIETQIPRARLELGKILAILAQYREG